MSTTALAWKMSKDRKLYSASAYNRIYRLRWAGKNIWELAMRLRCSSGKPVKWTSLGEYEDPYQAMSMARHEEEFQNA